MDRRVARFATVVGASLALVGCAGAAPGWSYVPATAPATARAEASGAPSAGPAGTPATIAVAATVAPSSAAPQASAGVGTAPPASADTIAIEAFDLGFTPSMITVAAPGEYTVVFRNTGSTSHDVTFADGTKIAADAGATATGTVAIPAGGLSFICSIPGHADAGMKGSVMVGAGAPVTTPVPGSSPSPGPLSPDPNAAAYTLIDATAPQVMSGTAHDVDMPIIDKDITVAAGFVVHAWTFGGTVPAPTIRVHLGDTVRVHLTNRTAMSHSIDFHASQTAMNDQMVEIKPGGTFIYTFTADYAGVWMYHCGTAPTLHHIANGMYGMVIVEPKGGLPKVDREVAFVQSEWYLAGQNEPASLPKAASGAPAPDFVVFNGVANQYKDHPIAVPTKGRVRVFVLDAGPNIDSSFHVVGTIFDTVTKEGITLTKGNADGWGSQAVDLSPAQGAIIEFSPQEDGMYPLVTHAFNFVGRGAVGLFMAGDGDPKN